MLQPKRTKFRKQQNGRRKKHSRKATSGNRVEFGVCGLQALDNGDITARQLESVRRVISRALKRSGKIMLRVFPDFPCTSKGVGVRQGTGKGGVDYWVARVKPGTVVYEVSGVPAELAREALLKGAKKLSGKCRVIDQEVV